jgi:thioredoxin reductase/SAM-dependent methyltransferase
MDAGVVDVIVVGGSAAGMAAALQLGRVRRSVVVVDAGQPRNAPASHLHGYLGRDGVSPRQLIADGRREVRGYGVEVVDGSVVAVTGDVERGFDVELADGSRRRGRRLLVATGLTDELPPIPGVAAHWGRGVVHCPYCHGWEVRDSRVVVIDTTGLGAHQALLFRQLSSEVTLVVHEGRGPDEHQRRQLAALGVAVVGRGVAAVDGDGHDRVTAVVLADGDRLAADAVVVGARFHPNLEALSRLGLAVEPHASGLGDVVATSPTGTTSVPGVYAAGNVADPRQQVLHAAAHGSQVAAVINLDLVDQDADGAARSAADALDWDERYGNAPGQMWSGAPNGSLVAELADLSPGRALDIRCGEGADAIWLARRGWQVTAIDISSLAIERARTAATAAGIAVDWQCADVLSCPPPPRSYDVVTLQYPALLRAAGEASVRALLDAVAPGGTFLAVGHAHLDPDVVRSHGFEPADYVDLDDLTRLLADDFDVVSHEVRPRPAPPAGSPHSHDTVLRARRRPS